MEVIKESTETPDSMKVLYIEDNEHNISLMQEMMSLIQSIDLEIVQTGVAGIRAINRSYHLLVLLDINLGDISGLRFCGEFGAAQRLRVCRL